MKEVSPPPTIVEYVWTNMVGMAYALLYAIKGGGSTGGQSGGGNGGGGLHNSPPPAPPSLTKHRIQTRIMFFSCFSLEYGFEAGFFRQPRKEDKQLFSFIIISGGR